MSKGNDQKKSGKSGKGIAVAGSAAVILAALALLNKIGFGPDLGLGKVSDEKPSPDTAQVQEITTAAADEAEEPTEAETEPETTEAAPVYADIKVSGSTYTYDGQETDTEALVESIMKLDGDVIVRITDDSATQNAMETLKSEFDKKNIAYIINE